LIGMEQRRLPVACTLQPSEVPARLSEWQALLAHAVEKTEIGDGVRVQFDDSVDPTAVVDLAARERDCCAFFTFAVELSPDGVALEIRAPGEAAALARALAGVTAA
jgi:hypothetical protein